jgi:hypothetical protein
MAVQNIQLCSEIVKAKHLSNTSPFPPVAVVSLLIFFTQLLQHILCVEAQLLIVSGWLGGAFRGESHQAALCDVALTMLNSRASLDSRNGLYLNCVLSRSLSLKIQTTL